MYLFTKLLCEIVKFRGFLRSKENVLVLAKRMFLSFYIKKKLQYVYRKKEKSNIIGTDPLKIIILMISIKQFYNKTKYALGQKTMRHRFKLNMYYQTIKLLFKITKLRQWTQSAQWLQWTNAN